MLHRCLLATGLAILASAAGWGLLAAPSQALSDVSCPTPTISGTPQGLTATPYACTGTAPITYSYAWSDGTTTTTNTTGTLPLTAANIGQTFTVTVTATDSTGTGTSPPSAGAGPVAAPATAAPTYTGTVQQGDTLTAHPGSSSGYPPPTPTYSWSDGTSGVTDTLSAADVGKAVTFTDTETNSVGTASASVKTAIVKGPPANNSLPTISGTPHQGDTLTASPGGWSGYPVPTYSYLWSNGATTPTDTLSASDVGQSISVTVTASNTIGTKVFTGTATSVPTAVVTGPSAAPVNTSLPTISGTAEEGATLTADPGAWTGNPAPSFSYLWSDGTTTSTDTLSAADVGKSVSVTVTASNIAGSGVASSVSFGPVLAPGPKTVPTTIALAASPNPAVANQTVTLIATVTSASAAAWPYGTVAFKNGGTTIAGCANVAVVPTAQSVTVTCQTTFAAGTAPLTAVFAPLPGSNLTPSASTPDSLGVALPPQVPGSLTSTMQWTFSYTPKYTTVMALVVNGAMGATVAVNCQGKGCPFAKRAAVVAQTRRCGTKGKRTCATHGTVDLTPAFASHRLRVGARITVMITRPGWIGKYYSFTMRARRGPRITIACLAPGGTRPGAGC